jgi:hypothetical protein
MKIRRKFYLVCRRLRFPAVDKVVLDISVNLGVAHLRDNLGSHDLALCFAPALDLAEETQRVWTDA